MEYLNKMINTEYKVASFEDGNIMMKTKLKLNFANIQEVQLAKQDVQMDKKNAITVDPQVREKGKCADNIEQILGEQYDSRRATHALATGTVYGVENDIVCENKKHSIFGLNRRYVNNQGLPNETAIIKRLRELGVSSDVKESRYGLFYNAIFANDFYDNMTPLLAKLHLMYNLASITERMNTHNHTIMITTRDAEEIFRTNDKTSQIDVIKSILHRGNRALGYIEDDTRFHSMLDEIDTWYRSLPDKNIKHVTGQTENPEYTKSTYTITVKVWHMYEYDDGNSKSGKSFGNEFGFKNKKFLIPMDFLRTSDDDDVVLIKAKSNHFESDVSVNNLKRLFGFLNGSGLSRRELTILNYFLNDYGRTTPFLCDQHVPLGIDGKHIEISTTQVIEQKQIQITSDDIGS